MGRAHVRRRTCANIWLYEDDYQSVLAEDSKHLGDGALTLAWRSDRGEDEYLRMCQRVLGSSKFSNVATLKFWCQQLPLDSRFVRAVSSCRPKLRALDIHAWTYYTHPDEPDADMRDLEHLQVVDVNLSDGTAFPQAWNDLVKTLPPLGKNMVLANRGCDVPALDMRLLPSVPTVYVRNIALQHQPLWSATNVLVM